MTGRASAGIIRRKHPRQAGRRPVPKKEKQMKNIYQVPSLYEKLRQYSESGMYPFHMPGHKRQGPQWASPFSWDITEIDGFDDLHHPEGILKEAMEEAAVCYGSDASFFLINGSTCGILAAMSAAVSPGDRVLAARNCHKSVYHGLLLNQLEAVYLYPDYLEAFECFGGVRPEQVEAALSGDRKIRAVVLPSPTYEGLVSDIRRIGEICRRYDVPLIVDEAHGAHFPFHSYFPASALELGADAVIQSLHKTLPAFTQTAILHVRDSRISRERLEMFLRIYQSSSPSYILMAGIDACLRYMTGEEGKKQMEAYVRRLTELRQRLGRLTALEMLPGELKGQYGIRDLDRGKILLTGRKAGLSGPELYEMLRRCRIQPEMKTRSTVLLMTSLMDSEEGLDRLAGAAEEIDRTCSVGKRDQAEGCYRPVRPVQAMSIARALARQQEIHVGKGLEGRISAAFVYIYPPGIPLLAPGEVIDSRCLDLIRDYLEAGLEVHGILSEGPENMRIPVIV